ncbi:MAG: peptidoglycan-binding protein [Clostridia bacterium]|nr:peptidoglycan-binding protein [Clostridia bacterium]
MINNKKSFKLMMLVAVNLAMLILISDFCTLRSYAINLGENGERIAALQKHLKEKGYYSGEINGLYDFSTKKAVKNFKTDNTETNVNTTDFEIISSLGINSKTNKCFSAEVELLAKYLKTKGVIEYHNMVEVCENILKKSEKTSLYGQIISEIDDITQLINAKPNSEQYNTAYEAVKRAELYNPRNF